MLGGISARRRGLILVLIATLLWSSAGFFARLIDYVDVWTMLGWPAFFGDLRMLAAALVEWRRRIGGLLVMGALIWRLAPEISAPRKASLVRSIKVN
jgi:hypothetical protein